LGILFVGDLGFGGLGFSESLGEIFKLDVLKISFKSNFNTPRT